MLAHILVVDDDAPQRSDRNEALVTHGPLPEVYGDIRLRSSRTFPGHDLAANRSSTSSLAERKQTGGIDLEAAEMAFRAALHQAGAAALTQLLQFSEPAAELRAIPCPCGHQARYRELRSRCLLPFWAR